MPAETHVDGDPFGRDEVLALVRDRLADILEIEPSGIRNRTSGSRPSARNASTCSEVRSRQKPSYPMTLEPEALRRASTSSLRQ